MRKKLREPVVLDSEGNGLRAKPQVNDGDLKQKSGKKQSLIELRLARQKLLLSVPVYL